MKLSISGGDDDEETFRDEIYRLEDGDHELDEGGKAEDRDGDDNCGDNSDENDCWNYMYI